MSEEVVAKAPTPWDVPAIDGSESNGFLTAGRLEALQKEAYDEAFKQGHADGLAAGQEEVGARTDRLDQLLRALARPFDELDETVEKQLVELAMMVVRQLFRREIQIEPTHIIGVVREAIQLLPVASRNVKVHMHPEDADLVHAALSPADGEHAWDIVEDPLMARGGCNVTTDNSQIDATAESRLQAIIAAVSSDQRQ